MQAKLLADSGTLRPVFRKLLLSTFVLVLLCGSIASIYANTIWLKLTQTRCRDLYAVDQNAEAIKLLRGAVLLDPTDLESLFLLVRGHRRTGDVTRALLLLDHLRSLNADPDRIDLEEKLILVQSGRIRESKADLSAILMKGGDDGSDVLQAFVLGYFANLRTNEASDLLNMWQQSTPNHPQAYFLKAYLLQSLGQLSGAIAEYRKGLKLAPQNQIMRQRLAECLIESSQIEEARAELNAIQSRHQGLDLDFLLAKCDYADQDFKTAERRLNAFLESDPDNLEARTLRGRIRLEVGESAKAIEDLQVVVDKEPTKTKAREALGRALVREQRKSEADQHFDFVRRASQAESDLTRLSRQSINEPDNAEIRFQIAQLATEYVSREDGAKWMRTVLEVQPDHVGANEALAEFYELQGDMHTALMYRRAIANNASSNNLRSNDSESKASLQN